MGLFGFTVEAGKYIDVDYGTSGHWMHSWLNNVQTDTDSVIDGISGPAPFITKVLTTGPEEVELNEDAQWLLTITVVNNDASNPITGVMVQDNLGGDLELLKVNGEEVDQPELKKDIWSDSTGDVSVMWTGKTLKAHLSWDVGDLTPGQSKTLTLLVSTDMNTGHGNGKNLKFLNGHQEYTETGTHYLNSGATATGMLDGTEWIIKTAPIEVECVEPNGNDVH